MMYCRGYLEYHGDEGYFEHHGGGGILSTVGGYLKYRGRIPQVPSGIS